MRKQNYRNLFKIDLPKGLIVNAVYDAEDLESVSIGDIIAPFGDYYLNWDETCVAPSELETWRSEGDELCDEVVRTLKLRPGQDCLQRIEEHLALPLEEQAGCVKEFWQQITALPPDGVTALDGEATPAITSCNRHPRPTVSEGQAVFWRYSSQIFSALLHYSLAGGFSANRLVGVLRETSYLTGEARDRTYRRLLETTQAITDYMNDLTPITGRGWKSAIRVRVLHATVRVRLENRQGVLNTYDEKKDGVPINQEDMLATLGSFAIAPLWSLDRQGVQLSHEEKMAYVAVWRHIGYYLGISPYRLRQYYSSVDTAYKIFSCHSLHLLSTNTIPLDHRTTSTYRLLAAVADRPPRRVPLEHSMALSRFLLGEGLADRLALPPTRWTRQARLRLGLGIEKALVYFGRIYTKRWEIERISLTRLLIQMIVCWQLGEKRTKFTIKPETDDEKAHAADNDDLDPEITMGPAAGKAVVRRWKWLLIEMATVVAVPCLITTYGAWRYFTS